MAQRKAAAAAAAKTSDVVDDIIKFLPQRYVERFPIAELDDFPGNPKEHDLEAIDESVDENGWYAAIVAQESTKRVLAGHGRRDTLLGKGQMFAPVIFVDCDDRTARRIVLADNRTTTLGGYSLPRLAQFVSDEQRAGNLRGTGYDDADHEQIVAQLRTEQGLTRNDDSDDTTSAAPAEPPRERFPLFSIERVQESAFHHFRASGFPYRRLPLHVQLQELNALAATPDDKAQRSLRGSSVADTYNPHRFEAGTLGRNAPVDAFKDDEKLRHAIRLELDAGTIGEKYFGALNLVRGTQACANFRPGYAMSLYRQYAPIGGVVLDPCTGYGGRLVGWLCSQRGELGAPSSIDFVFTSPPYFAKERYSYDDTQSWVRYKTIDAWRDGFLAVLVRGCYDMLKAGARCIINVADVDIGGKTYPLEAMTRELAGDVGFTLDATLSFDMATTFGQGDHPPGREPVFVFRKPQSERRRASRAKRPASDPTTAGAPAP